MCRIHFGVEIFSLVVQIHKIEHRFPNDNKNRIDVTMPQSVANLGRNGTRLGNENIGSVDTQKTYVIAMCLKLSGYAGCLEKNTFKISLV